MAGVGGVSGLARPGLAGRPSGLQRLQPSSAGQFFIVTPLQSGAMVYQIVRDNAGDLSTPPASLGAPIQPWRLAGAGWLANPAGDAANPDFWWSNDIGAQDYAFLLGGLYGGSYHGGETAAANQVLANGVALTDLTLPRTASQFALRRTSTITWSAGNTATIADYTLSFNPDGSLSETCPISSTLGFSETLLGMLIANEGFSEARLNDLGVSVPLQPGRAILRAVGDLTIRNPANGRWMRQTSSAPAASGYSRTEFRNGARAKLYLRLAGAPGSQTIQRHVSFGQNWFGSELALGPNLVANGDFSGGLAGWSVQAGSQAAVSGGALRLTRQAAAESRVMRPFATQIGRSYLFSGSLRAASDVGLSYGVTSAANFSVSTPAPPVMQSPFIDGSALAGNLHLFVADQTTHYVMARQTAGPAGQVGEVAAMAVFALG